MAMCWFSRLDSILIYSTTRWVFKAKVSKYIPLNISRLDVVEEPTIWSKQPSPIKLQSIKALIVIYGRPQSFLEVSYSSLQSLKFT